MTTTTDDDRAIAETLGWHRYDIYDDAGEYNCSRWTRYSGESVKAEDLPTLETDRAMCMDAVEWLASRDTLQLDVYESGAVVEIAGGGGYLKKSLPAALRAAMMKELGR